MLLAILDAIRSLLLSKYVASSANREVRAIEVLGWGNLKVTMDCKKDFAKRSYDPVQNAWKD